VQGENARQQVGFGLPRRHYAVDQVTFGPVQRHYPVDMNHVPFVGTQDLYQVEQVHPDPPQEYDLGEPVRGVWQEGR